MRRRLGPAVQAQAVKVADVHPDADSDPVRRRRLRVVHPDADPDSDVDRDPDFHSDADEHSDADFHSDADVHSDPDGHADADVHSDPDGHADSDDDVDRAAGGRPSGRAASAASAAGHP